MEPNFVKANQHLEQIGNDLARLGDDKVEDRATLTTLRTEITAKFSSLQTVVKTLEKMSQCEMNPAKRQNAREY